jgi:hypothetical protein
VVKETYSILHTSRPVCLRKPSIVCIYLIGYNLKIVAQQHLKNVFIPLLLYVPFSPLHETFSGCGRRRQPLDVENSYKYTA